MPKKDKKTREEIFNLIMKIVREKGYITVNDLKEKANMYVPTASRTLMTIALDTEAIVKQNKGEYRRQDIYIENKCKYVKAKVFSIKGNIVKFTDLNKNPVAKFKLNDVSDLKEGKIVDIIVRN